jgi:hypothetical protein
LALVALSLFITLQASAQDTEGNTVGIDSQQAALTVQKTIPVSVSVDVSLNGQVYKVSLPATLIVDAQDALLEAVVAESNRVGVLGWVVMEISESTEEYIANQFSSVEPSSPDNKLVIVTSEVTNLDREPQDPSYSSTAEVQGFDELGNMYEPVSSRFCEELDPGESAPCTIVFDVPNDVKIAGIDLKVTDHKQLTLQPAE